MSKRIWALTRKLDKLVQRRGVEVLQRDLPRSQQYVMVLRPTPTQRALYNAKVESMAGRQQLFEFMTDMLRIYNHPAALLDPKTLAPNAKLVAKAAAAASIDAAAAAAAAGAAAGGAPSPHFPPAAPAGGAGVGVTWLERAWPASRRGNPAAAFGPEVSSKVAVALALLQQAARAGERILLFSQSLESLDALQVALRYAPSPRRARAAKAFSPGGPPPPPSPGDGSEGGVGWQPGLDYLRLDGKTSGDERDGMVRL